MKKIFSVYGSMFLVICTGSLIGFSYEIEKRGGWPFFAFVAGIAPLVFAKMMYCFFMMQGQLLFALRRIKQRMRAGTVTFFDYLHFICCLRTFKMPLKGVLIMSLFPILAVVGVAGAFFLYDGYPDKRAVIIMKAFTLELVAGVVIAGLHWIFHWKEYTYASEYNCRVEMEERGMEIAAIEAEILRLRRQGIFGPSHQ